MTHPAEGTILPCPFCGNEPTVMGSGEGRRGLMIHCIGQNCPNPSVSYYNHAAARAVWNRRAAHSQGGKALADAIAVIRAEPCPFREGPMADGWAEAWATFLNRLGDEDGLNNLYANSTAHSPAVHNTKRQDDAS